MAGAATQQAIVGRQFGELIVLMEGTESSSKHTKMLCVCSCGEELIVAKHSLVAKRRPAKSCFKCAIRKVHANNRTHGKSKTRLYHILAGMKRRCLDPLDKDYSRYGGRGVTICEDWLDINKFETWALENGYTDELSIDRINGNGNYEPANCRFVTISENSSLTKDTHWLEARGEKKTIAQWVKDDRCFVNSAALYQRWKHLGWSIDDAIFTPPGTPRLSRRNNGKHSSSHNFNV